MNTPTVQELLIRIERLEARVLSLEGLTGSFHRLGPGTIPSWPEIPSPSTCAQKLLDTNVPALAALVHQPGTGEQPHHP